MLIISLTSYPARIETVYKTIKSLLNQTLKADKIILWLAPEQFKNYETDLPQNLLSLKSEIFEIDWYTDIKSYKKLIPALHKYPDSIIVTADDDNIYSSTWLEKLYKSYQHHPHDIQAHRVSKFYYENNAFHVKPGGHDYWSGACYLNKLVGLGGVLYPPHCFYKDVLNENLINQLAPTNDDQWFWLMGVMNDYPVRVVKNPEIEAHYIPGTQESGLYKINDDGQKLFWKDFNYLLKYYPQAKRKLIRENQQVKFKSQNINILKDRLSSWYYKITKQKLNLYNPQTFNEKIQWSKLYDSTPIKTLLADKYLVRNWVKNKIGEDYLIPLLGVYNSSEEIDFNCLPDKFVIKCNHGCAYNIIVKNKNSLDINKIKQQLNDWMQENFAFKHGLELHYSNISPKIIIEKFIENKNSNGDLYDYKFWCFEGKVYYIQFLSERNTNGLKMAFYDRNWNKQKFAYSYPLDTKTITKPDNLEQMIKIAESLSEGFNHVRVDLYRMDDGKIYFGEMTFTSASGICGWSDQNVNRYFGKLFKLPELAYDLNSNCYYKLKQKRNVQTTKIIQNNKNKRVKKPRFGAKRIK